MSLIVSSFGNKLEEHCTFRGQNITIDQNWPQFSNSFNKISFVDSVLREIQLTWHGFAFSAASSSRRGEIEIRSEMQVCL